MKTIKELKHPCGLAAQLILTTNGGWIVRLWGSNGVDHYVNENKKYRGDKLAALARFAEIEREMAVDIAKRALGL
jgi:hypothetical protein